MSSTEDAIGCFSVVVITAVILIAVWVCAGMQANQRNDGRTREQLVERGLAEYVIVDAQTGATEWRWKQ